MLKISKSVVVIILLAFIHFYFYTSDYVKYIDYKLYDVTSSLVSKFQEPESDTYSVVVDIDEQSIQFFGQWPWSRVITTQLINLINEMSPSAIGVNILFSEKDRLSPLSIQKFYEQYFQINIDLKSLDKELRDNDKLLLDAMNHANATLSIYLQNSVHSLAHCEALSYKNNLFREVRTPFYADELLCNHVNLQKKMDNFGFINAWRDSDGILRRVPLFIKHKEEVFPSLALATLLSFYQEIDLAQKESVLVNLSTHKPKVISVLDFFRGKVKLSDVQGKVVILGSSIVGKDTRYRTSQGDEISNSMIHAYIANNILSEKLLVQPEIYKQLNILFSLLLSLLMLLLFFGRNYFQIVVLLITLLLFSLVSLFLMYFNGIYISLGYLWGAFFSFFLLFTFYHLRVINQEKVAQEKLFIRQSKLASMGEMIALIAHQWRQPLSAINGTVLNMDIDNRKKILDEKKLNNYLDDIENTTAYLSKTINDFTDFFAQDKMAHRFSLEKTIHQAKNLAFKTAICEVKIVCVNGEKVEINGYASELVQSLLVLLNNAIYACQNLHNEKEGKIFIYVSKVGKDILISVEDNGGGVPKKEMKKIFDPYYTTKDKQHGTGLGLYVLKLIVEDSMNGKISLFNTQEGAVFTIKIPQNID